MNNISSYFSRGLESARTMFGDEGDCSSTSYVSIMDCMGELGFCCQDTVGKEDSDRKNIESGHGKMMKPWRPPRYRDTSLVTAPSPISNDEQDQLSSSKIVTPSIKKSTYGDNRPFQFDQSPAPTKRSEVTSPIALPSDFVPPRHSFARKSREAKKNSVDESVSTKGLESKDVVCGRGAPTSIHPGNLAFKKMMKEHEMLYLCSKRKEKPKIATKLLRQIYADGIRFVKRERDKTGSFVWIDIGEKRAYEKVCQTLREGAPQLRRQLMFTEARRSKNPAQQHLYNTSHQRRQDSIVDRAPENCKEYELRHQTSSFNGEMRDRSRQKSFSRESQLPFYEANGMKDHRYDSIQNHDTSFHGHQPPYYHRGEEWFALE